MWPSWSRCWRSDQALADIYGIGNVTGKRLPLVQVPTTAGTGSEVTNIAIVTTGATTKMGVVAPQLYADLAILDAALTLGLPPIVTAATGIDAMVHAIEAYTSKHKKNPLSDALAREALSLLSSNLIRACEQGDNLEVRQAMLLGACLAGQAFSTAPAAAVHALAYPIGGIFHVPHGLSNSLVLPHVLRFNLPNAAKLYAELAAIWYRMRAVARKRGRKRSLLRCNKQRKSRESRRPCARSASRRPTLTSWRTTRCCRPGCSATTRASSPARMPGRSTPRRLCLGRHCRPLTHDAGGAGLHCSKKNAPGALQRVLACAPQAVLPPR